MKKIGGFVVLCLVYISLVACSAKISQSDAERMIVEDNSNHLGKASVVLNIQASDGFVIHWKNHANLSEGTTKVFFNGSTDISDVTIQ